MINIIIRTDASDQIGTGHVMRCITLADMLKKRNCNMCFVSRYMPQHLQALIVEKGYDFVMISHSHNWTAVDELAHAEWLGVSQQQDAADTLNTLTDKSWDWVVVDHYALDIRWENILRNKINRVMVIDDIADRNHDCDLLLDQNLYANKEMRYSQKVSQTSRLLFGPKYALLQPIYARLHNKNSLKNTTIKRILIYFGGADNNNLTGLAIDAFLATNRPDINVDIVISATSIFSEAIHNQIRAHHNIELHINLPSLAPLIVMADLAIGAGGATTWERLCLGLPSIVITLADNQYEVANHLNKLSLINYIGDKKAVSRQDIVSALQEAFNLSGLADWSFNCMQVCDGRGAERVADAMVSYTTAEHSLSAH